MFPSGHNHKKDKFKQYCNELVFEASQLLDLSQEALQQVRGTTEIDVPVYFRKGRWRASFQKDKIIIKRIDRY